MCLPDLGANIAATRRFLRACTVDPLDADLWESALCWNMVVPPQIRGALIAREIDADDVLAALSVPVLVIHGLEDSIVLPSMARHAVERCRDRGRLLVRGHRPHAIRRGPGAIRPGPGEVRPAGTLRHRYE